MFETNLIRSHSRNSVYLARVKLMSNSIPKILEENTESKSKEKRKNIARPCLSGKISIF